MQLQSLIPVTPIPGFSDPFSSMTHLLGAAVFLVLGVISLYRYRGATSRTLALAVFFIGVIFALSMSGVFHLLSHGTTGREVLQRIDHAAIFFLIAATFTPVHVMDFRGVSRWGILLVIWAAAIAGIALKSIYFNDIPEWLSMSLYLGLGWAGALSGWMLFRRFGIEYIKPLIYGALAYTVGATLEFARFPVLVPQVVGPHELFHVLVLVGVAMHWWFVHRVARKAMVRSAPYNEKRGR